MHCDGLEVTEPLGWQLSETKVNHVGRMEGQGG